MTSPCHYRRLLPLPELPTLGNTYPIPRISDSRLNLMRHHAKPGALKAVMPANARHVTILHNSIALVWDPVSPHHSNPPHVHP